MRRLSVLLISLLSTFIMGQASGTKGGICPAPGDVLTICYIVAVCLDHDDCPGEKLCCFNGCTKDCHDPVETECRLIGGECKRQDSGCCPAKIDYDITLCNEDKDYVCCLPYPEKPDRPPSPSNTSPIDCQCSLKHQEVCCNTLQNYAIYTDTPYFPGDPISTGCGGRSCIPRGPDCPVPEEVCLKNPILNLLDCAPKACTPPSQWELNSILNADHDPESCNGKSVTFGIKSGCDLKTLKDMCEDVGGTFSSDDSLAHCTLP